MFQILFTLGFIGCSSEDYPDEPIPPDVEEIAARFFSPTGILNEETANQLGSWLLQDGGAVVLGSGTLVQSVLPDLLSSMETGLLQGNGNQDSSSALPFEAGGWLRMSLPCGEEEEQRLTLQALFSTAGLDPTIWGDSRCQWEELGISLDGDLSFFLSPSDWAYEQGSWINIDGQMSYGEQALSGAHHLMVDTQGNARVLWEQDDNRFIVTAPVIDLENSLISIGSIEEFAQLSVTVETETGVWQCDLSTTSCSGPDGGLIEL